ncbi:50S ribosomal protein L4, partial [Bienertia sinuspersici]
MDWPGTVSLGVTWDEVKDFKECHERCDLNQLKLVVHYYSWSNKAFGDGRTSSRIDWAFGNTKWHLQVGDSTVEYGDPLVSDHSPLMLAVGNGSKPQAWSIGMNGDPLKVVWEILKRDQYFEGGASRLTVATDIALRQKPRIQWLRLGDSNEKLFFSTIKARQSLNCVKLSSGAS